AAAGLGVARDVPRRDAEDDRVAAFQFVARVGDRHAVARLDRDHFAEELPLGVEDPRHAAAVGRVGRAMVAIPRRNRRLRSIGLGLERSGGKEQQEDRQSSSHGVIVRPAGFLVLRRLDVSFTTPLTLEGSRSNVPPIFHGARNGRLMVAAYIAECTSAPSSRTGSVLYEREKRAGGWRA